MLQKTKELIESLKDLKIPQLKAMYTQLTGEIPYSHNRTWLLRRICWYMQAKDEGGFSNHFVAHGLKHGNPIDARVTPPTSSIPVEACHGKGERQHQRDARIPAPGTVLERRYKGRMIRVKILENGFEWNGTVYSSFSKAVKTATGSNYGPYQFFKL